MKAKLLILSIAVLCLSAAPALAATFGDGGVSLKGALDSITLGPNPGVSSTNVLNDDISDVLDSYWAVHGTAGSINSIIVEIAAWAGTNTFGIYDMADPSKYVEVFDGSASAGSQAAVSIHADGSIYLNITNDTGVDFAGNAFGYYIDSTAVGGGTPGNPWTGGIWYSDSSLNTTDGQVDHMYAYEGTGIDTIKIPGLIQGVWDTDEYVLAFEDLHSMHWDDGDGLWQLGEWPGATLPDGTVTAVEPDFSDFVVMIESVDPVPVPAAVLLGILGLGVAGIKLRKYA